MITPELKEFMERLGRRDFSGLDLSGADFTALNFDFRHFNLTGANFNGTKLGTVELYCACPCDSTLTNADLSGAHLLHKANLTNADLRGAVMTDEQRIYARNMYAIMDEEK